MEILVDRLGALDVQHRRMHTVCDALFDIRGVPADPHPAAGLALDLEQQRRHRQRCLQCRRDIRRWRRRHGFAAGGTRIVGRRRRLAVRAFALW
jgi:hypothetical protein